MTTSTSALRLDDLRPEGLRRLGLADLADRRGGPDGADGDDGADGADGSQFLSGSGTPSGGTGADGDFYFATSSQDALRPEGLRLLGQRHRAQRFRRLRWRRRSQRRAVPLRLRHPLGRDRRERRSLLRHHRQAALRPQGFRLLGQRRLAGRGQRLQRLQRHERRQRLDARRHQHANRHDLYAGPDRCRQDDRSVERQRDHPDGADQRLRRLPGQHRRPRCPGRRRAGRRSRRRRRHHQEASSLNAKTFGQEAVLSLAKIATDTWRLFGHLELA